MIDICFAENLINEHMNPDALAIVQYSSPTQGDSVQVPETLRWNSPPESNCKDMDTASFVPVPAINPPQRPDHIFNLVANFRIGDWRLSRGFFNDSSWRPDIRSPLLSRFVDGYRGGNESFTQPLTGMNTKAFSEEKEMVIQVDGIKTIDVVVQNLNEGYGSSSCLFPVKLISK